ncbi:uncharacterized protein [Notothenia coriiceps]|uniref:C-type lectin domain-containing protein n=1 Tax=Notothenia coriiceps TaxID=8208 RepID=A0A6I9NK86_9TELE|nr:PREDICTED: uncharacterized protein LOC104951958 [Notothenia coriiceps]
MEPELSNNPDFKVEPDVQEAESEESHIDMEEKYELVGEPIMQQEPLDEDNVSEANQNQDPVNQRLSEEGEGLTREKTHFLDGEPTMELENQQVEDVPELSDNPDFKVESEVKVEPDVETEERHIDMEDESEMAGNPIMEMEPLDDDDMSEEELSNTEKSLRAAFQHQDPVNQYLSEEEEGLIRENTYVLDGEPILELEQLEVKVQENFEEEGEEGRENDIERKYEIVGEPIMELEPLEDDNEPQKEFPVQMNLEEETKSNQETEEKHIDMEARYEMVGEPIMELEPLDDDNMHGEKLSSRSEVNTERKYEMMGEPIMELEPLENKDTEQTEEEGGPALDIFGQPMKTSEEYFPNEEARMGSPMVGGSDYLMMDETASEFFQTDQMSPMAADSPVINHVREPRAWRRQAVNNPEERRSSSKHNKQGQSCSPGVMIEGKCYQFFKEPKKAADAEFFCQDHFSGGHLASISSLHVHREVMNLIRQNGGLTRTWVGGLRYLEVGYQDN